MGCFPSAGSGVLMQPERLEEALGFEAEIENLDGRIRGLFDADAGYRALLRIPGIGPVFAAILRGRDR